MNQSAMIRALALTVLAALLGFGSAHACDR